MNDIANIQIIIPLLAKAKPFHLDLGFLFTKVVLVHLHFSLTFLSVYVYFSSRYYYPCFFYSSSGEINKECDLLLCLHEREETKANTFLSIFQEPSSNLSAYKKSGTRKLGLKGQGSKKVTF